MVVVCCPSMEKDAFLRKMRFRDGELIARKRRVGEDRWEVRVLNSSGLLSGGSRLDDGWRAIVTASFKGCGDGCGYGDWARAVHIVVGGFGWTKDVVGGRTP